MGRRARDYCEVASRTVPTYSDVELALVDMGKQNLTLISQIRIRSLYQICQLQIYHIIIIYHALVDIRA